MAPTIEYRLNPALPIIKDGWKGNPVINGRYVNIPHRKESLYFHYMKSRLVPNPQFWERLCDTYRPEVVSNDSFPKEKDDMIVWLGHSSFFIRIDGVAILTDPSYKSFPLRKRKAPLPCGIDDITGISYVIVSHAHRDHADKRTLKEVFRNNPDAEALVPLGFGKNLSGITENIREAGWYQQYRTKGPRISFLPADHWAEGFFDRNRSLWGSFMLEGAEKTIYFGGDTAWGPHFEEIAEMFPKIDAALLPIGAYKPEHVASKAHISPAAAVKAADVLKARTLIPMHYGTYPLGREAASDPIRDLERIRAAKTAACRIKPLKIGEVFFPTDKTTDETQTHQTP